MSLHVSTQFSGIHSILSPNGAFIASISSGNRLTIRSTDTLEVAQIFQCVDKIEKIEISPDSCYVMCALLSRNVIQVFSIEDKDWKCRINEGVAGVVNAYWTPDSRNIVTESDFGIQLSLWSLTDSNSVIVSLPKPPSTPLSKTTAFSDCGRFLAVVHRIELQDQIGVYTVASQTNLGMSEVSKFRARSNDVAAVYWVPGGTHIVTLDSPLSYKFCAYTPMGECLVQYEAYQNALGIRCLGIAKPPSVHIPISTTATTMSSEPSVDGSKFLAVGSFDGKVRLISVHSWQVAFALPLVHPRDLEVGFKGQKLLLTVECMVGHHPTASDKLEEEEVHIGEGEEHVEGASLLTQRQVPHAQQQLPCRELRPIRRSRTLPEDSNEQDLASSKEDAETAREGSSQQHTGAHDSYFALKSAKTLPRAQPFILDTKRSLSGTGATLGKSIKRPTSGAPPAHSSSQHHGTGSSSVGGFPQMGVSWVGWSKSCNMLAAREETHPRCLWVWRPLQAQLVAVLVLLEPVLCARWRPAPQPTSTTTAVPTPPTTTEEHTALPPAPPTGTSSSEEGDVLAFCTGSNRVYFWTAASGVTYTDIYEPSQHHHISTSKGEPHQFNILSLRWAKDGMSLILRGKEAHCLCTVNIPHIVNKTHSTEG